MASLPKLEEVIRAPPPKTAPSSSDSSSSSSSSDREKSRREGASPESRHTLEGPGKQRSRRRNRSPGSAHDRPGSPGEHCSSRRSKGRYAERSREKAAASHKRRRRDVRSRSPDAEFRSDSSDDSRRHRHENLLRGNVSKDRPESSAKEGSHRRDGHRHKRHKHKCVLGTFIIPEFPGALGYARRYMVRCMHEDPTGIHAAAVLLGWRVCESLFFLAAQEGGEHQGGAAQESQQAHRRAEIQRGSTQEEVEVREAP